MDSRIFVLLLMAMAFLFDVAVSTPCSANASSMNLTNTPEKPISGLSENVELTCQRLPGKNASSEQIWWLRISRQTPSGWKPIADLRNSRRSILSDSDTTATASISQSNGRSFLQVIWSRATPNTFGLFRCESFGVSKDYGFFIEKTEMVIEQTVDLKTLSDFWNQLSNDLYDLLPCAAENTSSINDLELKIIGFGHHLTTFVEVSRSWPDGSYALLEPAAGCPKKFRNGDQSFLRFHEESSRSCLVRKGLHLSTDFGETVGSNCFLNFRYCEIEKATNEVTWPEGKFCISKLNSRSCPNGFSSGSLKIDNEDDNNAATSFGQAASTSSGLSNLYFCCTTTGTHLAPIELPTIKPFYLYRYGGECQQVQGMNVTQEQLDIETEDNDNDDAITGATPDVNIFPGSPTVLHLCYYTTATVRTTMS